MWLATVTGELSVFATMVVIHHVLKNHLLAAAVFTLKHPTSSKLHLAAAAALAVVAK